jgi:hypothetical protein
MLCLSYYCLFLLFNRTEEKHRTGFGWKQGGRRRRKEPGGRNAPNNVCTCE